MSVYADQYIGHLNVEQSQLGAAGGRRMWSDIYVGNWRWDRRLPSVLSVAHPSHAADWVTPRKPRFFRRKLGKVSKLPFFACYAPPSGRTSQLL